jgi:hypothetical protein
MSDTKTPRTDAVLADCSGMLGRAIDMEKLARTLEAENNRLREQSNSVFLDQLKDVSNRALDNMEGEDLQGFKNWEAVHVKSRELWVAIKTAEAKNG